MNLARTRLLALLFCAALLGLGCKQNEGDPCDVDEDCAEGLDCHCERIDDGVVLQRGLCLPNPPETCLEPVVPTDAGPEAGVEEDAGPDAAVEEDAGTDGGLADAGTDAGPADAGTDGGPDDAGADGGPADASIDAG